MNDIGITMKEIVEKLTPIVADIISRERSGSIEIHFKKGEFQNYGRVDLTF